MNYRKTEQHQTHQRFVCQTLILFFMHFFLVNLSFAVPANQNVDFARAIDRPYIKNATPRIGLVAPNILAVPISDGRVIHGGHEPYSSRFLDFVQLSKSSSTSWLIRNGEKTGVLVGSNRSVLFRFDQVVDRLSDTTWLDAPVSYQLFSASDPSFAKPAMPSKVSRKSRPSDLAEIASDIFSPPVLLHTLYLHFPYPLREGHEYTLRIRNGQLPDQVLRFNSVQVRSEAIHVNTLGFHPADGRKIGFLSAWLGSGGGLVYPAEQLFRVVSESTGQTVFEGRAKLSLAAFAGEDHQFRNFSGADVYLLDFSALNQVGRYRIVVPGIGSSYSFSISPDVWTRAFSTNMRGLYHQRSGIAHGGHYTKPRDLHPGDGIKVYQSNCSLMDSGNGLDASNTSENNFACLLAGRTSTLVPEAWGGYHDAGDWDRRIQHLDASRNLIELFELFPEAMRSTTLNIPEANNALPDVLDEILWNMSFFRRLQTTNGGIRGGVESEDHPRTGEASWMESQMLMAYAPDMWSSYLYAADAARLSLLLAAYDSKLASDYASSALSAARYAETAYRKLAYQKILYQVKDARNLAAAALYKLTGQQEWHDIYRTSNRITGPQLNLQNFSTREENKGWNQQDAAFLYLTIKNRPLDPELKSNLQGAFINEAEAALVRMRHTGFRWLKESDDAWLGWGTLGASQARILLRAHSLSGDKRYLDAALEASQFALGANPLNMSFTTGLGNNTVRRLWVIDARVSGQEVPEGITAYGPIDPIHLKGNHNFEKYVAPYVYPKASTWPANENYFDVYAIYPMNEFTIFDTIAPNIYVWGYLNAFYSTR